MFCFVFIYICTYIYIYVYVGCIFPLDFFPLFPIISFSFMLFFFALAFHFVPLLVCLFFRLCNFFRLWLLSAVGTERNDIQWTGPQGPLFQCSVNAPRTQADLIISHSLIAVWLPLEEGLFSFSHHREVGSQHWIRENLNDIRQLKYFLNNGSTSWLYKLLNVFLLLLNSSGAILSPQKGAFTREETCKRKHLKKINFFSPRVLGSSCKMATWEHILW